MFLISPQLCSGFTSIPWQERSKLGPEKMGVKCDAGPALDVSSDSPVGSHVGVSCLSDHPLPNEIQAPTWSSAAGALCCSGGRFLQVAARHCGLHAVTLYLTYVQQLRMHMGCRHQPLLHEDTACCLLTRPRNGLGVFIWFHKKMVLR